jgi:hypothetical protein
MVRGNQPVTVAIFSAKYDREFLNAAHAWRHQLQFFEPHFMGS